MLKQILLGLLAVPLLQPNAIAQVQRQPLCTSPFSLAAAQSGVGHIATGQFDVERSRSFPAQDGIGRDIRYVGDLVIPGGQRIRGYCTIFAIGDRPERIDLHLSIQGRWVLLNWYVDGGQLYRQIDVAPVSEAWRF